MLTIGAGDENRTRVLSLETVRSCQVRQVIWRLRDGVKWPLQSVRADRAASRESRFGPPGRGWVPRVLNRVRAVAGRRWLHRAGVRGAPQTTEVIQGRRLSDADLVIVTLLDDAPDGPARRAKHDDEEVGWDPDNKGVEHCCSDAEDQELLN